MNATKKAAFLLSFAILSVTGCQQDLVQRRANKLTATVPNMYYDQILSNLAVSVSSPETLPYFGVPTQGTHTNSRQFQGGYTPGWDLLFTGTLGTKAFLERYLFDKQSATFQGTIQNQEAFQLQPVSNPDKLFLMQAAYKQVTGNLSDPILGDKLKQYYDRNNQTEYLFNYEAYVRPGWFRVTKDKHEAYKNGCYIGHSNGIYVYVTQENIGQLSKFTLSILDIATTDSDYFYGQKKAAPTEPPGGPGSPLKPRSQPIYPFPAPPVAPTL
jgi:hypothetical protein